eukprot:TRINITY_DN11784_c0_g1_i2.p1 TRINITY_DN11784_c0_g1~~TRINITY_DN11784_c0_g1_i2.p1  ORF type:complete len:1026 (-),score=344.29 TRINITY_DN11784_c0_g1_i2:209-3247(-)
MTGPAAPLQGGLGARPDSRGNDNSPGGFVYTKVAKLPKVASATSLGAGGDKTQHNVSVASKASASSLPRSESVGAFRKSPPHGVKLPKIGPVVISFDEMLKMAHRRVEKNNSLYRKGGVRQQPSVLEASQHGSRLSAGGGIDDLWAPRSAAPKRSPMAASAVASGAAMAQFDMEFQGSAAPMSRQLSAPEPDSPTGADPLLGRKRTSLRAQTYSPGMLSPSAAAAQQGGKSEAFFPPAPAEETEEAKRVASKKERATSKEAREDSNDDELAKMLQGPSLAQVTHPDEGFSEMELQRMQKSFKRFKSPEDPEVHKDDLNSILGHLGYTQANRHICEELSGQVTDYATMDFEEFHAFCEKFRKYELEMFRKLWNDFDEDGSNEMTMDEMAKLLSALGIVPLKATLEEAIALVDADGTGTLDFDEFVTLIGIYRVTEGFTRKEISHLKGIFDRFATEDAEGKAALQAEKMTDALLYMFGPEAIDMAKELVQGLTAPPKGGGPPKDDVTPPSLGFQEFLVFSRRLRNSQFAEYKKQFESFAGEDMILDGGELLEVMKNVGFQPLKSMRDELMSEVDEDGSGEIEFEEFVQLMVLFREREGFSKGEVQELEEAFKHFDEDGGGEVSTMELMQLMQYLGYNSDRGQVQEYVNQVDVNGDGTLDFREFLHLMHHHREDTLKKYRKIYDATKDENELVSFDLDTIFPIVDELEYKVFEADLEKIREAMGGLELLDFDDLVVMLEKARQEMVRTGRRHAGFPDEEISNLKELFEEYDKDGNGTIDRFEFIELVKDLGMHLQTVEDRNKLMNKVEEARERAFHNEVSREEAGEPHHPTIPWLVFVHFVRMVRNEREEEEQHREDAAMAETGFSQIELAEFREVFTYWVIRNRELTSGDISGPVEVEPEDNSQKLLKGTEQPKPGTLQDPYLPFDGLRRTLRSFGVELSASHDKTLEKKVSELAAKSPRALEASGRLGFPEFLCIMKWMLDTNFARIKERSNELAKGKSDAAKAAALAAAGED